MKVYQKIGEIVVISKMNETIRFIHLSYIGIRGWVMGKALVRIIKTLNWMDFAFRFFITIVVLRDLLINKIDIWLLRLIALISIGFIISPMIKEEIKILNKNKRYR